MTTEAERRSKLFKSWTLVLLSIYLACAAAGAFFLWQSQAGECRFIANSNAAAITSAYSAAIAQRGVTAHKPGMFRDNNLADNEREDDNHFLNMINAIVENDNTLIQLIKIETKYSQKIYANDKKVQRCISDIQNDNVRIIVGISTKGTSLIDAQHLWLALSLLTPMPLLMWVVYQFRIRRREIDIVEGYLDTLVPELQPPPKMPNDVYFNVSETANRLIERISKYMQELKEASYIKENFLRVLSHEIRSPMSSAYSHMQLALITNEKGQTATGDIKHAMSQINYAKDLLTSVLNYEKAAKGYTIKNENIELHLVMHEIASSYKSLAKQKGVQFIMNLPSKHTEITIDKNALRIICSNMLDNAIKYTREGQIAFNVKCSNGRLELVFDDTGIGIPTDKIDEIFNPWTQMSSGFRRQYGGVGLGLATTKNIIGQLGGYIEVRSAVKAGTRFIISLPCKYKETTTHINVDAFEATSVQIQQSEGSNGKTSAGSKQPGNGKTILLIDDSADQRLPYRRLLEIYGYKVIEGESGVDAINKNEQYKPDMIILDLHMPIMDGEEALMQIRLQEKENNVAKENQAVIVIATADLNNETHQRLISEGADTVMVKPLPIDEFNRYVQSKFNRLGK